MGEFIFLQTDPTFNLVLLAMRQLQEKRRLPVGQMQQQRAFIRRIERAADDGENAARYTWNSTYNFARTASACFRMAMLEAAGIPRNCWPVIQGFQQNTHVDNMDHEPAEMNFHLANDCDRAKTFWSEYDRLYPANYITLKYTETAEGESVPLNSMMVIFRNDFTEMIEITTTVRLQRGANNAHVYNASVHVLCIKRQIVGGDAAPHFDILQALCRGDDAAMAGRQLEARIAEAAHHLEALAIVPDPVQ